MAASNAARPRPNKNSNGQDKKPQPTMSHDISISPAKPEAPAPPPPPPGQPLPGHTNPMTHPQHPAMQSNLTAGAAGPKPGTAPAGPTDAPKDQRQVQERIQFKDLPPVGQSQAMQQQGIDPYAMFELGQQKVGQAVAQGPSQGPVPNALTGPGIPQDMGLESFPDDMAHLTTLMHQGYAPGASAQEHGLALNAHSMARAKLENAFANAQNGAGQPTAPAPSGPPLAPPTGGPAPPTFGPPGPNPYGSPPGPPVGGPPQLQSSLPPGAAPGGPPIDPNAPGGIPTDVLAQLLKKKPVGAVR